MTRTPSNAEGDEPPTMAERLAGADAAARNASAGSVEPSAPMRTDQPSVPPPTPGWSRPLDHAGAPVAGSRAWAIAIAIAAWSALYLAMMLVVLVVGLYDAIARASREESLALLDREEALVIIGIGWFVAMGLSIIIGVRVERLRGWRTWLVVAGCLIAFAYLMTLTWTFLVVGYLIVFLVLWARRRRSLSRERAAAMAAAASAASGYPAAAAGDEHVRGLADAEDPSQWSQHDTARASDPVETDRVFVARRGQEDWDRTKRHYKAVGIALATVVLGALVAEAVADVAAPAWADWTGLAPLVSLALGLAIGVRTQRLSGWRSGLLVVVSVGAVWLWATVLLPAQLEAALLVAITMAWLVWQSRPSTG